MKIAGILLAAGRSTRFGPQDKLSALLNGCPLLIHAANAMRNVRLDVRFVVRGPASLALDDFDVIHVPADAAMSHSLAAGIVAARESGATAALVTLADMPFVETDHLAALIAACDGSSALIASFDERRSPPALFGSDWFESLEHGTGDVGARSLIAGAKLIRAAAGSLRDIDTLDDLAAAGC